jgi:hypothetical protein
MTKFLQKVSVTKFVNICHEGFALDQQNAFYFDVI